MSIVVCTVRNIIIWFIHWNLYIFLSLSLSFSFSFNLTHLEFLHRQPEYIYMCTLYSTHAHSQPLHYHVYVADIDTIDTTKETKSYLIYNLLSNVSYSVWTFLFSSLISHVFASFRTVIKTRNSNFYTWLSNYMKVRLKCVCVFNKRKTI